MRPRLLPIALLLPLAACAATDAQAPAERPRVWRSYDELEHCTTLVAELFTGQRGRAGGIVGLFLNAHFPDSAAAPARTANLLLSVEQVFVDDTLPMAEVKVGVGGSPPVSYIGRGLKPSEGTNIPGAAVERAQYPVPLSDLRRLAGARTIAIETAGNAFTLDAGQMAVLRDFVSRVQRGSPGDLPEGEGWGLDCESWQGPENTPRFGS